MGIYILLVLSIALASMVQSTIGFGAAILMMNIITFFLDVKLTMVICQFCCVVLSFSVILRYRSHIRIKVVLPLMFPALLFSAIGASISSRLDVSRLKLILGVLFILLSFYFYFLSSRIKLSPTPVVGIVVGTISGSMSGLFSMGGPPAVLYLAPALEKKEEYLATSQAFFITSNLMSLAVRLYNGVVDASVLPYLALGIPTAIGGTLLGGLLLDYIKPSLLKKLIYLMIGVNGLIIVIKSLV